MTAALDSLLAAVQGSTKQQGPTAAAAALGGSKGTSLAGSSRFSRGGVSQKSVLALALCGEADASSCGGDVNWVKGVVLKLKELLLESDRCACVLLPY